MIAADPRHRVTAADETIASTNFLSGWTQRPAYLQRLVPINEQEEDARMKLMDSLLQAHSAAEVRSLLERASFDYLLVYADHAPAVDLTCCMELVFDGSPRVYRRLDNQDAP